MQVYSHAVFAKMITDVSLFVLMYWVTSKFAFVKSKPAFHEEDSALTPDIRKDQQ